MNVRTIAGLFAALCLLPGSALAQSNAACQGGKDFSAWLQDFKAEARTQGISDRTLAAAEPDMSFDQAIVNKDHGGQGVFAQSFLQFSDRMANNNRLQAGKAKIKANAATFQRIEQQYGVPAGVLTAFWGLETDFGGFMGDGNTIRSVTTLAYDCRRPDLFRGQLLALLKIIERGDLSPAQMRGPWAGELGQFQFLPTHYIDFGLDFDGDGHVNLIRSDADALGSAANYIKHLGWRAGEPWLVEVKVSKNVPWDQADLTIEHPASQWTAWGVTRADGSAVSGPPSSLHLPMGRHGPAFLAYPNFKNVYLTWNHSLTYSITAGYLATRLEGAPPMSRGDGTPDLDANGVKELQRLLQKKGYDVGKIDGIIGAGSRAAIKKEQMRLGQPADSYPSTELLEALRSGT
jgi:lytic murein transglycosylase